MERRGWLSLANAIERGLSSVARSVTLAHATSSEWRLIASMGIYSMKLTHTTILKKMGILGENVENAKTTGTVVKETLL